MNGRHQLMQLLKIILKNMVGASRFERPTSCSQGRRANQAALRPDKLNSNNQITPENWDRSHFPLSEPI